MRHYRTVIAAIGGLGLTTLGTSALAGGCGSYGAPQNCAPNVVVTNSAPTFDPVKVVINQPMGHLRSVHYSRSPSVSITRVHGLSQGPSINDTPSGFTGGCHPTSTSYCGAKAVVAPVIATSVVAAPVVAAPVVAAPVMVVQDTRYVPRQYGDLGFVPGIANVPTSYVDRSSANAQAVLNSGRAVQQSRTLGGIAPSYTMQQVVSAPQPQPQVMIQHAPVVHGATMVGGMMATQVMCNPAVMRPVIGVAAPSCGNVGVPMMAPSPMMVQAPMGRWTY